MTNAGNTNTDGFTPQKTRSMGPRPGAVTRGVGHNKPRIHLVSSKGKIPAAVYAEAIAHRQTVVNPTVNTHPELASESDSGKMKTESPKGGNPQVTKHQLSNPAGVAKRPSPTHQNNPAFAGRFTPQGKRYEAFVKAQNNLGTKAPVNP